MRWIASKASGLSVFGNALSKGLPRTWQHSPSALVRPRRHPSFTTRADLACRSVSEVVLVGNSGTVDDAAPSETRTWASSRQFDTSTYTVQAWSGSAWQTVVSVSGNTKHIVRLAFAPVTTDRIRVIPADDASNGQTANDNLVSLTEIEVR